MKSMARSVLPVLAVMFAALMIQAPAYSQSTAAPAAAPAKANAPMTFEQRKSKMIEAEQARITASQANLACLQKATRPGDLFRCTRAKKATMPAPAAPAAAPAAPAMPKTK